MGKIFAKLKYFLDLPKEYASLELKLEGLEREHKTLQDDYKELQAKVINKTWAVVGKIDKGKIYYVVSQGGIYEMKGSRILAGYYGEVSRRAIKNGFVVATRKEALDLQRAMRSLVR